MLDLFVVIKIKYLICDVIRCATSYYFICRNFISPIDKNIFKGLNTVYDVNNLQIFYLCTITYISVNFFETQKVLPKYIQ